MSPSRMVLVVAEPDSVAWLVVLSRRDCSHGAAAAHGWHRFGISHGCFSSQPNCLMYSSGSASHTPRSTHTWSTCTHGCSHSMTRLRGLGGGGTHERWNTTRRVRGLYGSHFSIRMFGGFGGWSGSFSKTTLRAGGGTGAPSTYSNKFINV